MVVFRKEPGVVCPYWGFDENDEKPIWPPAAGKYLNGRYMVGKVLGIIGFGITYLGYDRHWRSRWPSRSICPLPWPQCHADQYSVILTGRVETDYRYGMERFLDEARILAKLQNTPHIVSVQNYFKGKQYRLFCDGVYRRYEFQREHLASQESKIPCAQAI